MEIKEAIDKEKYIVHNIKGISMLPLLVQDEDLVLVEKLKNRPKVLDMVLFKRDKQEEYILHRILADKNKYYLICGDNQNSLEKVYPKQIIGIVTGYYKKGRFVSVKDKEYLDYLNNLQLDIDKRVHLKPISKTIKDFMYLCSSVINDNVIDQSTFDYDKIYKLAKKQKLEAFVYKKIAKDYCPIETYNKFLEAYNLCLQRNLLFDNERQIIFNNLKQNNIKYIPLKGHLIDRLYPEYGTRYATDIDIYVKDNSKIDAIMTNLGYKRTLKNEGVWVYEKEPIYNIEFHNKPIETQKYPYLSSLFAISNNIDNYEYQLNNIGLLIHFLAHMYKHSEASVGLRFYIDFYYLHKKLTFDDAKLEQILKENKLLDYYHEILKTTDLLFNKNELPILQLNAIFAGGTFGSNNYHIKRQISENGRFKYLLHRLFPNSKYMYKSYPIVHKCKVLLPFAYIYRIINYNAKKNHNSEIDIVFKKKN